VVVGGGGGGGVGVGVFIVFNCDVDDESQWLAIPRHCAWV